MNENEDELLINITDDSMSVSDLDVITPEIVDKLWGSPLPVVSSPFEGMVMPVVMVDDFVPFYCETVYISVQNREVVPEFNSNTLDYVVEIPASIEHIYVRLWLRNYGLEGSDPSIYVDESLLETSVHYLPSNKVTEFEGGYTFGDGQTGAIAKIITDKQYTVEIRRV